MQSMIFASICALYLQALVVVNISTYIVETLITERGLSRQLSLPQSPNVLFSCQRKLELP